MVKAENIPWPENYYQTFDRIKRKELLLEHMKEGTEPLADEIRLKLWEARYQKRKRMSDETDYFVRGFLGLLSESRISINLLNKRHELKMMKEIMQDLCMIPSAHFDIDVFSDKELAKDLIYQEYLAFASFYLHFSMEDSKYCSALMGTISLSKGQIIEKLAKDFKEACVKAPQSLGLTDDFAFFGQACKESFMEEFPEYSNRLE